MKKAILKRLGSFILVCFMVVVNIFVLLVPSSAESENFADVYNYYSNLSICEENLFEGISEIFNGLGYEGFKSNVSWNGFFFESISGIGETIQFTVFLPINAYFVMANLGGTNSFHNYFYLSDQSDYFNSTYYTIYRDSLFDASHDYYYSGIFKTDQNFRILTVQFPRSFYPELYRVNEFDTVYDVSKTRFSEDMEKLFGGSIDLSKFSTKRVPVEQRTSPYVDFLAFYSDANWGDWSDPSYQSGNDYFYIYDCYGEIPESGSIRVDGVDYDLTRVSGDRFFTKFKSAVCIPFATGDSNSGRYQVDSITLDFLLGDSRTYSFQNFYVTIEYTNRTDWKIQKVSFGGEQKLRLNIDYTYWRQADYSAHPDHPGVTGWHNQIDSIYFGIPNALLQGQRLVDAKLEYQKVTTKPIVVTQTSENINGTYVSKWFEETAQDPNNELTHNQGWVRYQKGVPYFYADPALWSKIALIDQHPIFDYQFNVRTSCPNDLHSVYWAFDVEDPTLVDKVPNPGSTTGLSSSALSHPDASVSPDRLEQWMIHYDLTGATTTYTAANPDYRVGSSVPETVQVNGILFDHAEPRGTYYASQIAGRVLEQFGNNDNFWQNLKVGWNYAFAHLFNTVDEQNVVVGFSDFEIRDISDLNDENGDHKFALADKIDLQNRFRSCMANDETLILMPFDTSQYYSAPLYGWYKEGNVDSGSEDTFNGYLAIMDMYLDLHVIELYFENAVGEVIPVEVTSNHINGIAHVTPAPGNAELNEYAGETLKNMFQKTGKNIFDFLKKALVIIAVVVILLVVLRLVIWIVGRKQSNNTTVVIRDDAPRRNRRRRR